MQGAGELVGPIPQLLDRRGHPVLRGLAEVAAVVEHARDRGQGHAGGPGDVGERRLVGLRHEDLLGRGRGE